MDGTYLVADRGHAAAVNEFLALPDVQRALPRDVCLQWGSEPVGRGARTYKRLYVLTARPRS